MKKHISIFLILTLLSAFAYASDVINKDTKGIALKGYDVVAYFTQGKALQGNAEFEHQWKSATWRFATAENRDLFVANPDKYAPQFGGYCAYGVTKGYLAPIDPKAWKIVHDKLYLNYNLETQKVWEKDQSDNIATGFRLWPKAKMTKPLDE
ncbi:MAG TPA: YHS domain-containing (seleno)protein [Acidobacteriota bacterium]|nr:YHS domain-containing (seleno)protein [Acidobacteriota bacterium]